MDIREDIKRALLTGWDMILSGVGKDFEGDLTKDANVEILKSKRRARAAIAGRDVRIDLFIFMYRQGYLKLEQPPAKNGMRIYRLSKVGRDAFKDVVIPSGPQLLSIAQ